MIMRSGQQDYNIYIHEYFILLIFFSVIFLSLDGSIKVDGIIVDECVVWLSAVLVFYSVK
jgi:hypothetical protein